MPEEEQTPHEEPHAPRRGPGRPPGKKKPDVIELASKVDEMARESIAPPLGDPQKLMIAETALAKLIAEEDLKIKKGMLQLGATKEESELALAFGEFRDRHVQSTLGMTLGGLSLNYQRMLQEARSLEARLKLARIPITEGGRPFVLNIHGEPSEEAMVMESYLALCEECRRHAEFIFKGNIAKAKVEALIRMGRKTKSVNANTPGFAPKSLRITKPEPAAPA